MTKIGASFSVLVPATPSGLHPSVVPAILAAGYGCTVMPMREELDYSKALATSWWVAEQGAIRLVVIEHDVEMTRAVFDGLLGCPLPWCVAPYNSHEALGCAKFDPVNIGPWPLTGDVPWLQLDHALYRALMDGAGIGPHVHATPRPTHHHPAG